MDIFDEQTLVLTLKASNEGIWDWDRNSGNIFYSERSLEFLGFETSHPPNIMATPEGVVHLDDLKEFKQCLKSILSQESEDLLKIDCRIIKPNEEIRWIRIRGIVTREKNVVTRITGSMIDISKRKFAEEMIAEEQHMLRLIIDNIPLQVYFKDKESRYKLVNQKQAEWLGKKNETELINQCSKSFFSESSWQDHRAEEIKIMLSGEPVVNAIQKEEWPDREDTYVKKVKHPWYDSTSKLLGTYGISCDVTKLIKAKQKLERLAIGLQQQNQSNREEILLAKEIQRAILPHNTPHWDQLRTHWQDRLDIETLYEPASELAGDFYDVITLTENKLGFLIIDVTGHGVRSAMIISLIKGFMEQAIHLASKPAKYLEQINHGLSNILDKASIQIFVSASYTVIDFENSQVHTTCAGDNPPLFLSQQGNIVHNDSPLSPALGTKSTLSYKERSFPLDGIQSFLLYTDGIYSTPKKKEITQPKSLIHIYRQSQHQSSTSPLKYIFKSISESNSSHFQDDVCMVNVNFSTTA